MITTMHSDQNASPPSRLKWYHVSPAASPLADPAEKIAVSADPYVSPRAPGAYGVTIRDKGQLAAPATYPVAEADLQGSGSWICMHEVRSGERIGHYHRDDGTYRKRMAASARSLSLRSKTR